MPSVADHLRDDTRARVLAMTVAERIRLSLALGDDDVARYAQHAGLAADEARRTLRARHAQGRRPSRVALLDGDDAAR